MTIPTHEAIAAHCLQGGLWRIIPTRTQAGQPRPLFAALGINGNMRTIEGGDLLATIAENTALQGAEWVPVDSRGDRVE
jgi:hypothetical protein